MKNSLWLAVVVVAVVVVLLGLAFNGDPRSGLAQGGFTNPFNIDPATNERSYPAITSYAAATARRNLEVVTGALGIPLKFEVQPEITTSDDFANPAVLQAAMDEYVATRSGPLTVVSVSSALLSLPQVGGSYSALRENPESQAFEAERPEFAAQYALLCEGLDVQRHGDPGDLAGGGDLTAAIGR
ncbi:hypothetical protein B0T26DRAFT_751449 [Lasiosphaeria miniovina]|uniref:Uncharacterized protein n=1 Tax=Lasiosphaeria miniovina TaxID=1954250 RepID=A0AA40AKB1_9PEZI|nr:uncharacterized protein B0T26DRAFT_751449 [Lasiosphaeria miniovina]KAK0717374.1 hypothetical protein B0T26DRAFT_751449 [Lasiosphaeria miniovina]